MSDTNLHEDNDTPKAAGADTKRSDTDTNVGLGDFGSRGQAIGHSPTDVTTPANIQNSPKTWS